MTAPIASITAPKPADLRAALDRAFAPAHVVSIQQRPSDYRSSFALDELTVHLDDGRSLSLLLKDLSWDSLLDDGRLAKPKFLYDPRREIEMYRKILAPRQIGAVCFATVADDASGQFWIILERVAGAELYQVGETGTWQAVARWLGKTHVQWADHVIPFAQEVPLLNYNDGYFQRWIDRCLGALDDPADSETRSFFEQLIKAYPRVIEQLRSLPRTLIHGEFYASNVLVAADSNQDDPSQSPRVCPVDWEMAGVGPGLIDLAALTAGTWAEDQRESIVRAYADGWHEAGEVAYSAGDLVTGLDCCRLHLAIQWLGWSPEWEPPRQHAHDWLTEARNVARRLGIV